MSNKTAAQLMRKLDTFFSNSANNNKILKINSSGVFEGVDPSSFGGSGASALSASSLASLPVTGVANGTIGVVPNGSNYALYVWSGTTATGTTSLWKIATGSTSTFINSLGFTYAGSTTPPVDASTSNSFEGISVSGDAVIEADGIEINQGISNIHQTTGTVSTTLPSGLQFSVVTEIDFSQVVDSNAFRMYLFVGDGINVDYTTTVPQNDTLMLTPGGGGVVVQGKQNNSQYGITTLPSELVRIELKIYFNAPNFTRSIGIYRVSDGAEIFYNPTMNFINALPYNNNPRFSILTDMGIESPVKVKRIVIDRNF